MGRIYAILRGGGIGDAGLGRLGPEGGTLASGCCERFGLLGGFCRPFAFVTVSPSCIRTRLEFGLYQPFWKELLFAASLLATGCACENSEVKSTQNSTGELRAVLFERNCGATTDFSTQISVLGVDQSLPNEAGNLFVADTDGGTAQAEDWGGPYASFEWIGERVLAISFDEEARVFKRVEELEGVAVDYRPIKR